jgi:hypothetical protein
MSARLTALALSLFASGCGLTGELHTTVQELRMVTDSLPYRTAFALNDVLVPSIKASTDDVLDNARRTAADAQDDVIDRLNGPVFEAVDTMLARTLLRLETNADRVFNEFADNLTNRATYDLQPLVTATTSAAVDAATDRLAAALEGALLTAVTGLADSVAARAVQSAGRNAEAQVRKSPLVRNLAIGGAALLFVIVGLALWKQYRSRRQHEQMLLAVTEAVHDAAPTELLNKIKTQAERLEINDEFKEWLDRKKLRRHSDEKVIA